ncbi:Apc15p protein-domain-containing protein [Cercophora newfieldiana]|uniref:Apc15p protein-domain-containing protein n=1 Tax=Cercophora newfieldiana TaxID=92897 RepID=A0AA40CI40_9PEZI|nr:Apc15p protein-domain-containing protein [Cercophora newfieldiana]
MFSFFPDLTPRDSHSLWYTSSRNTHLPAPTPLHPDAALDGPGPSANNPRLRPGQQHSAAQIIDRSFLGRLRDEERTNDRRRANVANLGQTWLKPPGVTKTLFQMREERREAEEHAEAMRREMLAQELAEAAEAGGGGMAPEEGGAGMDGDGDEQMMEGEGARDLDEDIPDADEGGFGFDGVSDDEEDDDEDEQDDEDEENESSGVEEGGGQLRRVQQRELADRVASMRATEDRMREMMARGGNGAATGGNMYGGDEDIDEEDQADILEEDDLISTMYPGELEPDMDVGMDANLDDDIPEAESLGGYEHTDSEASLSSDEDVGHNVSFGGMRAPHLPHIRSSMAGGAGPRSSMAGGYGQRSSMGAQAQRNNTASGHGSRSSLDISSILSRDGSSMMGSSPRLRRGN